MYVESFHGLQTSRRRLCLLECKASAVYARSPLSLPVDSCPEHVASESEHLSSKPEWPFRQLLVPS